MALIFSRIKSAPAEGLLLISTLVTAVYVPGYFIARTRTSDGLLGDPVNLAVDGTARQIAEEHRAIAEAATSREAARATALLRAHIEATGTELRARMQAHPPATP